MKILHVIPGFDPSTGGPPRIALRLAAATAGLGHDVTIIAHDVPWAREALAAELRDIPSADLVHFNILPPCTRIEALFAFHSRRELSRIVNQFDIVHTHSVWNGIIRIAWIQAVKQKIPFVILANGMLDAWALSQSKWKKKFALMFGMRSLINRADFIHVGNVAEQQGISEIGLTPPTVIIPNGIYPQEFDPLPLPGQFHAAHPELYGKPYILFLSRLHYKKGLDYLAAAFAIVAKKHPNIQLVVTGPDGGAQADFEKRIAAEKLSDRVHLVGAMFGRDRFTAFRDAICFCLPSRQEGFSVAILEAMATGTPSVITVGCRFPEVAEAGAGEVVPLDAPQIAAALDRIISDPDLRRRMGAAGQAMVQNRFTWQKVAEQTVAAYQRVLDQSKQ